MSSTVPAFVREDLEGLGFELPEVLLDRLASYLALLLETNQRINLTAIRDADEAWRRLIVDSLTPLPGLDDLEEGGSLIDVGSGGGMPGIPLAIGRPDLRVTLLEATGKKARFLESAVRELGLDNVAVVCERAETAGRDAPHRERYDAAVCRAVGPMNVLLELCLPLVRVGGRLLAMKGPKAEEELERAGDALDTLGAGELHVFDAYPETFANDLVIVRVAKDRATPKGYPRRPGVPKREPL
ncbi:MAG: 16S rRNA (guanine(527)-N(7))-methyltransferase RsmG [Phycisphaeraceae bacterium]